MEKRPHTVTGGIFNIITQRTRTGSILRLEVNFPQDVVQLSKEVNVSIDHVCNCAYVGMLYCEPLSFVRVCVCIDLFSLSIRFVTCAGWVSEYHWYWLTELLRLANYILMLFA